MSEYCEYCSHSLDNEFNCLPCIHLEPRPYADNTVVLEDLLQEEKIAKEQKDELNSSSFKENTENLSKT